MQAPEPGIYFDVPASTYHAWPYCSQSLLKTFVGQTPAHARHEILHPKPQTQPMALGEATHCAILEPGTFETRYAVGPPSLGRRQGKAWSQLQDDPRIPLLHHEYERIEAMRDRVWAKAEAKRLLSAEGRRELVIVWDEYPIDDHRVRCKARVDLLVMSDGWPTLVDLKTTSNAAPHRFKWSFGDYGYHIQAPMYLRAAASVKPIERRFVFLCVESDPPHEVALYEPTESALAEGQGQLDEALEAWARCERDDHWPGYSEGIEPLPLPEKYWRRE